MGPPQMVMARLVAGPALPSGVRPAHAWADWTPACVRSPQWPSTRDQVIHWTNRTAASGMPRLPRYRLPTLSRYASADAGPNWPSTRSPRLRCHALVAAIVRGPRTPSTPAPTIRWTIRTSAAGGVRHSTARGFTLSGVTGAGATG